jgi:DNA-binding XRE family transcriptional regulator
MTQEQLAMLLGVSRQSVTKWEAEKSYPEMDKLLKICQIFDCSLDDLVQGDLTSVQPSAVNHVVPSGPPTDICGYDEHMRKRAFMFPTGVALAILGAAISTAVSCLATGPSNLVSAISSISLIVFIGAACAVLIPLGIEHNSFEKAHPFVEDFYTRAEKDEAARKRGIGIVVGIIVILAGLCFMMLFDGTSFEDLFDGIFLVFVAAGVWIIMHWSMLASRMDLDAYNANALEDISESDIESAELDPDRKEALLHASKSRKKKVIGSACGIIMMVATIVALIWLFSPMFTGGDWNAVGDNAGYTLFWLPWPIGGIVCGIVAELINVFMKD